MTHFTISTLHMPFVNILPARAALYLTSSIDFEMISYIKCNVTGIICFLSFVFNVTDSYSQQNVTKLEKNEEQNQCENWLFTCKNGLEMRPNFGGNEHSEKIIQAVSSLNRRLDDLEKKIKEGVKLRIPAEIVEHVKYRRFCVAEHELSNTDDNIYYEILHQVYNNSASNFNLLLKFGDSIENVEHKYKIYDFLFNETVPGGFNDTGKLLRFSQSIKTEILDKYLEPLAAKALYQNLEKVIEETVIRPISSAFQNNNRDSWRNIFRPLSTVINNECPECTIRIYNSVVESIWNQTTLVDLLNMADKNLQYFDEEIAVHVAVADKLESTNTIFNTTSAITLARHMKRVMNYLYYKDLNADLRSRHLKAKNKLSNSIKNLVFSEKICLKSVHCQEYFYASDEFNQELGNMRNVYTSTKIENSCESGKFKWKAKFVADNFTIQLSNDMIEEDLYSEQSKTFDSTRRQVFTTKLQLPTNQSTDENTYWRVEVEGDLIHLRNVNNNEYLFADLKEKKDDRRRYVFTHIIGKLVDTIHKWEIIDCS